MLPNGTKVRVTSQQDREGVILMHRRIPKTSPEAYQYKVEFADGKWEWIRRYEVKTIKENPNE